MRFNITGAVFHVNRQSAGYVRLLDETWSKPPALAQSGLCRVCYQRSFLKEDYSGQVVGISLLPGRTCTDSLSSNSNVASSDLKLNTVSPLCTRHAEMTASLNASLRQAKPMWLACQTILQHKLPMELVHTVLDMLHPEIPIQHAWVIL